MKRLLPLIVAIAAIAAAIGYRAAQPAAVNPDPNHTHVDFAVFLDGEKIDFSGDEYMSGSSDESGSMTGATIKHNPYLHLHDGNGSVIHRHKPGLTLQDFFDSLSIGFTANCIIYKEPLEPDMRCSEHNWRMYVNGQERPFGLDDNFADLDRILLTTSASDDEVRSQLSQMTDDACRYSRTCPEKGPPPTENCIADPTVPCVVPK
jgi:hypothetical protein